MKVQDTLTLEEEQTDTGGIIEQALDALQAWAASVAEAALGVLLPRPGTVEYDLHCLRHGKYDEGTLRRLAARLHWWPQRPAAKAELRRRMAERGREAYFEVFAPAIILATANLKERQRLRFGAEFLTDDNGKPAMVVPRAVLPLWSKGRIPGVYWFIRKETIAHMERFLLDDSLCFQENEVPLEEDTAAAGLLEAEVEAGEDVWRLLQDFSPQEKSLLLLIAAGNTPSQAAVELGIAPSTARVMLLRIRKKAAAM